MNRQKRALAIHDISCIGRCSLTVALPILSAAGINTGILPTAVLSTHTGGFTGYTCRDLTDDIEPISEHWKTLSLKFDAIYSGYLASTTQTSLVEKLYDEFSDEDTIKLVDPAMADNGKFYPAFGEDMAKGMARLCAKADIIVPNLTEAAFILGEDYQDGNYDEDYIKSTLKKLTKLGAKKAVLTGVSFDDDLLGAACYDSLTDKYFYCANKKDNGFYHGTGDVFASALLSAMLSDFSLEDATKIAVDFTLKCIEYTKEAGDDVKYGPCFERALPYLISVLGETHK